MVADYPLKTVNLAQALSRSTDGQTVWSLELECGHLVTITLNREDIPLRVRCPKCSDTYASHIQNLVIVLGGMGVKIEVTQVAGLDQTLEQFSAVPCTVAKQVKYLADTLGRRLLFDRFGKYLGVTWTEGGSEENFYLPSERGTEEG